MPVELSIREQLIAIVREAARAGRLMVDPSGVVVLRPHVAESGDLDPRERIAQHRRDVDLEYALRDGEVQIAAFDELGVPLIDVGVTLSVLLDRTRMLAELAIAGRAPPILAAEIGALAEQSHRTPNSPELWQQALANIMRLERSWLDRKKAGESVGRLLMMLRTLGDNLPPGMREPSDVSMRKAIRALGRLPTVMDRPAGRPSKDDIPRVSPWRAAHLVAACFGAPMPEKESKAFRVRKRRQ